MVSNSDLTDLSSELDTTAIEADAFDKQELIVWASKLELESIDYRKTSLELTEELSKISKLLNESLASVKSHIFELKLRTREQERKYKNYIELTVAEELDDAYNKISVLGTRLREIQEVLPQTKSIEIETLKDEFNKFLRMQNRKNQFYDEQLHSLKHIIENIHKPNKSEVPQKHVKKIISTDSYSASPNGNGGSKTSKINKKSSLKTNKVTKIKPQQRSLTFTRKLID